MRKICTLNKSCNNEAIIKAISNVTETSCTTALLRKEEILEWRKFVTNVSRNKVCAIHETVHHHQCHKDLLLSSQTDETGQQKNFYIAAKLQPDKVKFNVNNWAVVFVICLLKIALRLVKTIESDKISAIKSSWPLSSLQSFIRYLSKKEPKEDTIKGIYSNDLFKRYSNDLTVFPLLINYSRRLASFSSMSVSDNYDGVSFITLSGAGFYFTSHGQLVKCEGCGKEMPLETFKKDTDPRESEFHNVPCSCMSSEPTQRTLQEYESRNVFCNDVSTQNCLQSTEMQGCDHDPNSCSVLINEFSYHENGLTNSGQLNCKDDCGNESSDIETITNDMIHESVTYDSIHELVFPVSNSEEYRCDPTDEGYTSDLDHVFIDAKMVVSEFQDVSHTGPIHPGNCPKNPGHFAYFPISRLTPEQLPSKTRCPAFLQFLQLFAKLTVKLTVNTTSKQRHRTDPLFQSIKQRVGTGFVLLEQWRDPNVDGETSWESGQSALANVGKYVKKFVKKSKKNFYIQTNRHLVFDDEEAVSTTVEFCIDEKAVRCFKVASVLTSDIVGDYRCTLVCRTSDHSFVREVQQIKRETLALADQLPTKTKKAMTKKVFMIEHPHGGAKVLSYGDSVLVKYQLLKDQKSQVTDLLRINNSNQGGVSADCARKMLLYAADTCQGSSGAPVIMFNKRSSDGHFVLDVWTHNGQHATHGLGCSVMKACSDEDLKINNEVIPSSVSTKESDSDSEDENCPGNQKVDTPVFKVLQKPSYPDYTAYQNRLDSFENWTYHSVHQPEHLAVAGFFYAGYSDCVRCFQCGLGLRSWKPGDSITEQHKTHRPSCPFLQSQDKNKASVKSSHNEDDQHLSTLNENTTSYLATDILKSVDLPSLACSPLANNLNKDVQGHNDSQPKDLTLSLLEKENEMLKSYTRSLTRLPELAGIITIRGCDLEGRNRSDYTCRTGAS
ncbi:hypothetical protein Btru_061054 [Bulinus truncatus]|nr:hypothetical protein Btru_061054 [Bulinus truncatus]